MQDKFNSSEQDPQLRFEEQAAVCCELILQASQGDSKAAGGVSAAIAELGVTLAALKKRRQQVGGSPLYLADIENDATYADIIEWAVVLFAGLGHYWIVPMLVGEAVAACRRALQSIEDSCSWVEHADEARTRIQLARLLAATGDVEGAQTVRMMGLWRLFQGPEEVSPPNDSHTTALLAEAALHITYHQADTHSAWLIKTVQAWSHQGDGTADDWFEEISGEAWDHFEAWQAIRGV